MRLVQFFIMFIVVGFPVCRDVAAGGRSAEEHSPRCCVSADCATGQAHAKFAVVTSIRSAEYLIPLRDLQCSLRRTNPDLPLIVLAIADELETDVVNEIKVLAEYRAVPNIEYSNTYVPRFSKNWFKLNAWNLTEYASVILLDADTVVVGNISHLFHLPTDFAWSYRIGPDWNHNNYFNYNKGGVIMLRPCQEVLQHMLNILEADETKHFSEAFAEQSFLTWYFAYTGLRLPMIYNANAKYLEASGATAGGAFPLVVHFADDKHFDINETHPHWHYMCHRYHSRHHEFSHLYRVGA